MSSSSTKHVFVETHHALPDLIKDRLGNEQSISFYDTEQLDPSRSFKDHSTFTLLKHVIWAAKKYQLLVLTLSKIDPEYKPGSIQLMDILDFNLGMTQKDASGLNFVINALKEIFPELILKDRKNKLTEANSNFEVVMVGSGGAIASNEVIPPAYELMDAKTASDHFRHVTKASSEYDANKRKTTLAKALGSLLMVSGEHNSEKTAMLSENIDKDLIKVSPLRACSEEKGTIGELATLALSIPTMSIDKLREDPYRVLAEFANLKREDIVNTLTIEQATRLIDECLDRFLNPKFIADRKRIAKAAVQDISDLPETIAEAKRRFDAETMLIKKQIEALLPKSEPTLEEKLNKHLAAEAKTIKKTIAMLAKDAEIKVYESNLEACKQLIKTALDVHSILDSEHKVEAISAAVAPNASFTGTTSTDPASMFPSFSKPRDDSSASSLSSSPASSFELLNSGAPELDLFEMHEGLRSRRNSLTSLTISTDRESASSSPVTDSYFGVMTPILSSRSISSSTSVSPTVTPTAEMTHSHSSSSLSRMVSAPAGTAMLSPTPTPRSSRSFHMTDGAATFETKHMTGSTSMFGAKLPPLPHTPASAHLSRAHSAPASMNGLLSPTSQTVSPTIGSPGAELPQLSPSLTSSFAGLSLMVGSPRTLRDSSSSSLGASSNGSSAASPLVDSLLHSSASASPLASVYNSPTASCMPLVRTSPRNVRPGTPPNAPKLPNRRLGVFSPISNAAVTRRENFPSSTSSEQLVAPLARTPAKRTAS